MVVVYDDSMNERTPFVTLKAFATHSTLRAADYLPSPKNGLSGKEKF